MRRLGPSFEPAVTTRLVAYQGEMGDAAWRADRLHIETVLEPLQSVPQAPASPEDEGHDRDVQVVDQVGGQKLANGRWAAADADVQATGGLLSHLQGVGRGGVDPSASARVA